MGRPVTGAPKWNPTRKVWEARIWVGDERRPVAMPEIAKHDKEGAMALAKIIAERGPLTGVVGEGTTETVNEWAKRWLAVREERGLASVADDGSRFKNHIQPRLGTLAIGKVSRDDVEGLVEELDRKILAKEFSWKTASHTWGLVTRMFKDACASKRRELRVRADDPACGVVGPDRGVSKSKVYLYPAEFLKVLSCRKVPIPWRRMFVLTTYMYARAGEVNGLTWEDVDLDRGVIHIHASVNRRTGVVGTTKSGNGRRIPIERELMPLLRAMHEESGGVGPVSPVDGTDKKLSRQLQRCLTLAGVTRADLTANDESRKQMTFHDLRATGITWCAVRGDDPLKIKQRAGHRTFSTTEGYIREAENLIAADFGKPFPTLPGVLLDARGVLVGNWDCGPENVENIEQYSGGAGNRTRVRK